MSQPLLFDLDPRLLAAEAPDEAPRPGAPRLRRPDRAQVRLLSASLDSLVSERHRVRPIWRFVERLDLAVLLNPIKSRECGPGRPAIEPRILLTLWLYATSKGIGSAREIERLCNEHDVYRWICGGVSVNYHTLSDFRSEQGKAFEDLLRQLLAALMHNKIVRVRRVAQDGMRVRASAGADSFRREPSLKECKAEAKRLVARAVKRSKDPHRDRRKRAAQERAAKERLERVERALAELPAIRAAKKNDEQRTNARASTTDPEARVMHMPDGGFRPAYNVQLATDTESRVIVGVQVTNSGGDAGQVLPMLDEVERQTGKRPKELLVDGGFVNRDAIEEAAERGVKVFAPVPAPKQEGVDPHAPKSDDPKAVAAWRRRMGTDGAKEIYKERASTAETINADLGTKQGLGPLSVRGLDRVLSVAVLSALTYNVLFLRGLQNPQVVFFFSHFGSWGGGAPPPPPLPRPAPRGARKRLVQAFAPRRRFVPGL
jgi:transposase